MKNIEFHITLFLNTTTDEKLANQEDFTSSGSF